MSSDLPIIDTSGRISFKSCRRRWDWSSDLRQGYKPIDTPQPLYFGQAVHAGLERVYDPRSWKLFINPATSWIVRAQALNAFREAIAEHKTRYLRLTGREALDEEQLVTWNEELDLGIGMLTNYFDWALLHDHFEPIATEIKFRVPIYDEQGVQIAWYQGRIDVIVRDYDGFYWEMDHKTTSRWQEEMTYLELDEQRSSYLWGVKQELNLNFAGSIYNELYKAVPAPPKENSVQRMGRWFSVNKNQATTYELYKATVEKEDSHAYQQGLYDEILQYFKVEGPRFFKRTQIHRNAAELREQGHSIQMETLDMLDPNVRIYKNPRVWGCNQCPFRGPCIAKNDGSDYQWMLDEYFVKEPRG
jgi:hypothetical protein